MLIVLAWLDGSLTELEQNDYLQEGDVGFKKPKVTFPLSRH